MARKLKRPEVLSPAGTLEKLKVAVRYGADAVFIGGQAYSWRCRSGGARARRLSVDRKSVV